MSQSPIEHVRSIKTPFLILRGTADDAVDWNEGLEFFNAARRNGKEVIFISYPNESHQWMTDGWPPTKKYSPKR